MLQFKSPMILFSIPRNSTLSKITWRKERRMRNKARKDISRCGTVGLDMVRGRYTKAIE
jgi:hypothetical protein